MHRRRPGPGDDHRSRLDAAVLQPDTGQAMSRENVGVVRRAYERWNSMHKSELEAWLAEFVAPEIEWHDAPLFPAATVTRGIDAYRRHVQDYLEVWAESTIEIEEIGSVGDRVVARIRYDGVGEQFGTNVVGVPLGAVYDLREGRIVRVQQFDDYSEALEAAELPE